METSEQPQEPALAPPSELSARAVLESPLFKPAAIFLATLLAYIPSLFNGYIWDDDFYVTANATLRSLGGLRQIWTDFGATPQYYPLVHTSFWIEYQIWGLNPAGFHLVNVILHAANAVLVGRILSRLAVPGAWLAAAVFALHPAHVESVAWITERKNVLSGFFYLCAFLAYIRHAGLDSSGSDPPPRSLRSSYALVMLCFVAALLSKTVTCTLPGAMLVVAWWQRGRIERRDLACAIPLILVGAPLGLLTAWIEKHHVGGGGIGASGLEWHLPTEHRLFVASRAPWFYLGKLLSPRPLAFIYDRWDLDAAGGARWIWPFATAIALVALAMGSRRIGRGPLAAALFFGGTLFPALGFIDVYPMRFSYVADHFQYLASIGPATLVCAGLALARAPRALRGWGAAVPLLAALGAATLSQQPMYRNERTLWSATVRVNPTAFIAHHNLGSALIGAGEHEAAARSLEKALALDPDDVKALCDLGVAHLGQGKFEEARASFERALRADAYYPNAHIGLGNALLQLGRPTEAEIAYRRATKLAPTSTTAHSNLGTTLAMQGRFAEAVEEYSIALRINPADEGTRRNLARARLDLERHKSAAP